MMFAKLRLGEEPSGRLNAMAQRVGLTPNLLARCALAQSLEAGALERVDTSDATGREFNAYTLLADYQPLFIDLVESVEGEGAIQDSASLRLYMRNHIERGIALLATRLSSPADLARLLAGQS